MQPTISLSQVITTTTTKWEDFQESILLVLYAELKIERYDDSYMVMVIRYHTFQAPIHLIYQFRLWSSSNLSPSDL